MLKSIMKTLKILLLTLFLISLSYFIYLHLFLSNDIKNNWDKYKCNPYVIPFAGLYEKNTEYNYRNCSKTAIVKIIDILYYPLQMLITIISKIFNIQNIKMNDIMDQSKSILLNMNSQLFDKKEDIIERLKNKDESVVEGLCFAPKTHIKLKNGEIKQMKDIQLGDELKNGSIVYGVMSLYNLKKDGLYISNMYCIPNGCDDENDIIVSGSHLLKENNEFVYVKNHKHSILLPYNMAELYCLITDDHNICIGDYVFSDWEDNGNIPELLDNNEYIENITLEYCN
jgi:hypothetical protein